MRRPPRCVDPRPPPQQGGGSRVGVGVGAPRPGRVGVRLGDTEGLGGGGMHCPFLPPQNPREGRPGLISLSTHTPPPQLTAAGPRG